MDDKVLSFLMLRAIRGVIRRAEQGDLPLFARTLGLFADQHQAMMSYYFPEYPALDELSQSSYALLLEHVPEDFNQVLDKVLALRTDLDEQETVRWLAHAIACAAYGEQSLWESMELADALQLEYLLTAYFPKWAGFRCGISHWQKYLLAHA